MEELISVIIPAYNAEETIEKCINSIINNKIEIIVVIDGATDNTKKACENLKQKNKKITIIEQDNQGPYEARKKGIEKAKGKYLMFLDADDYFEENAINRIKQVIEKYNEPELIRFRYEKEPDGYKQYKYTNEKEKEVQKEEFVKEVYPMFLNGYMLNAIWTNCVKKDVIKSIDLKSENVRYGEDLLLNLKIFSNINNVVFINDILYKYVYKEESITNSKKIDRWFQNLLDAIDVYTTLYDYLIKWNMVNAENVKIISNRIKKQVITITNLIKQNSIK